MLKHPIFMAKPIEGACGKGIEKISLKDQDIEEVYAHLTDANSNFILDVSIKIFVDKSCPTGKVLF